MARQNLVVTLVDLDGNAQEDVKVRVSPVNADQAIPVGESMVLPQSVEQTTNSSGQTTFSLLPTSETGSKYAVEIGDEGAANRAIFWMPDTASTLAAAIGYPDEDQVRLPFQGWKRGSARPTTPAIGEGYYNPDTNTLEIYSGTQWNTISAPEGDFIAADDYNAKVAELEAVDTALDTRLTTAESDIDDAEAAATALAARVTTAEGDIDAAETAATALAARVTTNETDIGVNADDLVAEQNSRSSADTTLQTNIDAEASARQSADASLTTAVTNEATLRGNADTALSDRIDTLEAVDLSGYATDAELAAETTARTTADTALGTRIDGLGSTYVALTDYNTQVGDLETDIQSAIGTANAASSAVTAETAARTAADTALSDRIDAIPSGGGGDGTHPLTGGKIHIGSAAPSDPEDGDLHFDTDDATLRAYDDAGDGSWEFLAAGGHAKVVHQSLASGQWQNTTEGFAPTAAILAAVPAMELGDIRIFTASGASTRWAVYIMTPSGLIPFMDGIEIRELRQNTNVPSRIDTVETNLTALTGRVTSAESDIDDLEAGGGGGSGGQITAGHTIHFGITQPSGTSHEVGDLWIAEGSTALAMWNGSAWDEIASATHTDQVTTNRDAITALDTRLTGRESELDAVEATALTNTTNIDNLTTRVTTAESEIDTAETNITTNTTNITSLTSRVTTAESDIDTLETTVAGIPTSISDAITQSELDTAIAGVDAGAEITVSETAPSSPSAGDVWISDNPLHIGVDGSTRPPVKVFRYYTGSEWAYLTAPAALIRGGSSNLDDAPFGYQYIWARHFGGNSYINLFTKSYNPAPGSNFNSYFTSTIWSSPSGMAPSSLFESTQTNAANIAVNTANIAGETTQRINGDAALDTRVSALETGGQLGGVTDETLTATDDDITIFEFGALDTEDENYLLPARAIDLGNTPVFPVVAEPTLGNTWENTSTTFVAGQSVLPFGTAVGDEFFIYTKGVLSSATAGSVHTLFSSLEFTIEVIPQTANTQIKIYPTGSSGTTITVPVAVASGGSGAFNLGISLRPQSDGTLDITAAINGTTSGDYTAVGGISSGVTLGYAANIGCEWNTPLQSTVANPTNHWRGAMFDFIVGERSGSRTSAQFATSTTGTVSDRTSLYNGQFSVANAQRYGRAVAWSERTGLPGGFIAPANIHHLREAIPMTLLNELWVGATASNQRKHEPEAEMVIADAAWLRRGWIDLGNQTIGKPGTSADVIVDDARMQNWLHEGQAFTITKLRTAPIWNLSRGWEHDNNIYDRGSFTTWVIALVRANATALGTPAGRANFLCVNAYDGRISLDTYDRWIRVGGR